MALVSSALESMGRALKSPNLISHDMGKTSSKYIFKKNGIEATIDISDSGDKFISSTKDGKFLKSITITNDRYYKMDAEGNFSERFRSKSDVPEIKGLSNPVDNYESSIDNYQPPNWRYTPPPTYEYNNLPPVETAAKNPNNDDLLIMGGGFLGLLGLLGMVSGLPGMPKPKTENVLNHLAK